MMWRDIYLTLSKGRHTKRGKEGADRGIINLLRLALDCRLRAYGARAGRGSRAHSGWRATDLGAARTRAGRAVTALRFSVLACIYNDRLLRRDRCLEHILRKIGHRGAFRFQHVVVHRGDGRAGRDTCLQDILGEIWNRGAGLASFASCASCGSTAGAVRLESLALYDAQN